VENTLDKVRRIFGEEPRKKKGKKKGKSKD